MSTDEDYLSDAFLVDAASQSKPLTYAERRKEARRQAELKNEQNRKRSRHELEKESRDEGLSRTLFDRAKEQDPGQSKALNMMLKMGFKPGESLGALPDTDAAGSSTHRKEPIGVDVWTGKEGLGRKRRAISSQGSQSKSEPPRMTQEDFRERARKEYRERRDAGRLSSVIKTCISLDQKLGLEFNYLWLKPDDPDSFPHGLIEALGVGNPTALSTRAPASLDPTDEASQLRRQMRADRLQEMKEWEDAEPYDTQSYRLSKSIDFSPETVKSAIDYCQLSSPERLEKVLTYLRATHHYCFWCGTQYMDEGDMRSNCPGEEEEMHE